MAVLVRHNDGRREYKGLTYLHRSTHDRKELRYQGHEFHKVYESMDTEKAYRRGLAEKREPDQSVVWTGEPKYERRKVVGRYYGVFVRKHERRQRK
jgi:hypothetical protein